jgi:ribosomal protein S18 acetylase RimI-like enzyme
MRSYLGITPEGHKISLCRPTPLSSTPIQCGITDQVSARRIASPVFPTRHKVTSAATRGATVCSAATTETSPSGRTLLPNFQVTSPDGKWRVRLINRANPAEIAAVVRMQTDGFHEPNLLFFLDSTFKRFFAAEVLSEMNKKLKYNPEDRFVCLVAEDVSKLKNSNNSTDGGGGNEFADAVVGVVEVSYIDEKEVLSSLEPGRTGVTYIQSMAVDLSRRRQGAAVAMLMAAEQVAMEWSQQLAVLHVYQDNDSAVKLYKKQGFEIIFQDAPWLAKLAVRPRFLMRKNLFKKK